MLAFARVGIPHVLTQGSTVTQKIKNRPIRDPHVCRVCSLDTGWQISENKGKVRINFPQLLI